MAKRRILTRGEKLALGWKEGKDAEGRTFWVAPESRTTMDDVQFAALKAGKDVAGQEDEQTMYVPGKKIVRQDDIIT